MQILVKTLRGRTIVLQVEPDCSVEQLKAQVQAREGIPPAQQRLIFGGRQLADGGTLAEYGVQRDCTLTMTSRLLSCRDCAACCSAPGKCS